MSSTTAAQPAASTERSVILAAKCVRLIRRAAPVVAAAGREVLPQSVNKAIGCAAGIAAPCVKAGLSVASVGDACTGGHVATFAEKVREEQAAALMAPKAKSQSTKALQMSG